MNRHHTSKLVIYVRCSVCKALEGRAGWPCHYTFAAVPLYYYHTGIMGHPIPHVLTRSNLSSTRNRPGCQLSLPINFLRANHNWELASEFEPLNIVTFRLLAIVGFKTASNSRLWFLSPSNTSILPNSLRAFNLSFNLPSSLPTPLTPSALNTSGLRAPEADIYGQKGPGSKRHFWCS